MRKIYLLLLLSTLSTSLLAQCPIINGALINACAADGVTEGINEFVYFTTPASGAVSLYKFSYGSRNPPASQTPTGVLSGQDASAKTGPGSVLVQPGNTLVEVTASATVIPAGSSVVFVPNSLDQVYDFTNICKNNTVYVVYINIVAGSAIASRWMAGGTMANAASSLRYLQMEFNGNACTANVRSYDGALWANPGNVPAAEGNALAWTTNDSTLYVNNGCSVIVTPVKLLGFTGMQVGKTVQLSWQTTSEFNTQSFVIERSANGQGFQSIGSVAASDQSNLLKHYQFTDPAITGGTWLYRLKIVDKDGSFAYSPVVKIAVKTSNNLVVAPTIATQQLAVQLNTGAAGNAQLLVADGAGRIVMRQSIAFTAGLNNRQLDIHSLAPGAYVLKLANATNEWIARFVKL